MSAEKPSSGTAMLQSIISRIVLAVLTGIGAAELKINDKLSDLRASMMPREEVEIRLHQLTMEVRALDATLQSDRRGWETKSQAHDMAISRLQYQIERAVQTGRP